MSYSGHKEKSPPSSYSGSSSASFGARDKSRMKRVDENINSIEEKLKQIDLLKQEIEDQLHTSSYQRRQPHQLDVINNNNTVGELQELCMRKGIPFPRYNDLGRHIHDGNFRVECILGSKIITGRGATKKEAKRAAAAQMIQHVHHSYEGVNNQRRHEERSAGRSYSVTEAKRAAAAQMIQQHVHHSYEEVNSASDLIQRRHEARSASRSYSITEDKMHDSHKETNSVRYDEGRGGDRRNNVVVETNNNHEIWEDLKMKAKAPVTVKSSKNQSKTVFDRNKNTVPQISNHAPVVADPPKTTLTHLRLMRFSDDDDEDWWSVLGDICGASGVTVTRVEERCGRAGADHTPQCCDPRQVLTLVQLSTAPVIGE